MLPFYSFIFVLLQNKIIFNTTKQNRSRFFWHNSSTQAEAVLGLWDMLFLKKKCFLSSREQSYLEWRRHILSYIYSSILFLTRMEESREQDLMERIINQ